MLLWSALGSQLRGTQQKGISDWERDNHVPSWEELFIGRQVYEETC